MSRYKNILFLVAVLMAQLIGLAVQIRRPNPNGGDQPAVRLIRYWAISLMSPPEKAIHGSGTGLRGMWSNYLDLRHVREQNQELKQQVSRLQIEQAGLLEDARQGQRLQSLLAFKEHYISTTVPAQVIGTSGTDQSRILYIDKGSKDGLRQDMAVITPDGIVGKLKDVYGHTSQVLVINDQTSGAGGTAGVDPAARRSPRQRAGPAADHQYAPRRASEAGREGHHQRRGPDLSPWSGGRGGRPGGSR